jgi:hypothetical protein
MPSRAMMMASASMTYTSPRMMLTLVPAATAYAWRVSTAGLPKPAATLVTAAGAAATETPGRMAMKMALSMLWAECAAHKPRGSR